MQDARQWVVDTFRDIERPELADCAELGVSELVTNALLHGAAPIQVRVRGTREHPRVEVRDASTEPPVLPHTSDLGGDLGDGDLDDLLLTFGRGLSIVARSSDAWGAEIEEDGKVVWFAPAAEFADDDGAEGVITGTDEPAAPREQPRDPVRIDVLAVPLRLYVGFQRHFRELRREVRLLALAHESAYPLAKNLSDLFGSLERQLRDGMGLDQMEPALAEGAESADVSVIVPRATAATLSRFIELLDLADEFCREERLLSLARTEEQQRFQRWYLGEFVRQAEGGDAVAWQGPTAPTRRSSVS